MSKHEDRMKQLQDRRIVLLDDNINRFQSERVRGSLLQLALVSDEPIRLLIESDGGEVPHSFAICDFIACLRAPVFGIVIGDCSSMAVAVLQACSRRFALEHAVFFMHCIAIDIRISQHLSDRELQRGIQRRILEGRIAQEDVEDFISKKLRISRKRVRRIMHDGDAVKAYLTAREAMKMGLIDGIVYDPKGIFEEKWQLPKV